MNQPAHEIEQGWWECPYCGETTHVVCIICEKCPPPPSNKPETPIIKRLTGRVVRKSERPPVFLYSDDPPGIYRQKWPGAWD